MSFDYNTIGASWASVWNELDEGARVARVPEIWAVDASHFAPGFEGHGLKAIEDRVHAHNRFVIFMGSAHETESIPELGISENKAR